MRRIFWLTVTIFTIAIIVTVVLVNVYSLQRFAKADCNDSELIAKIHDQQIAKNFIKANPEYEFEIQGTRSSFPSQCQYLFYFADGVIQKNLWLTIDTGRHDNIFGTSMCFDHSDDEPRFIDPYHVPDLTSKNC